MSNYQTAPSNGLFTLTGLKVSRTGYRSEPMIVQLCDDERDKYQFGFNGQMKMNEVAGMGNWNTAEFWEYDTRTATRKNRDPVRHANESPYLTFHNSPIFYSDPLGNDPPEGFKTVKGQGGDLSVPQSTTTSNSSTGDLNSFTIGSKTFSAQYDESGKFSGYFNGADKYETPDISLESGGISGDVLDATFKVTGVPASGLQFVQTLHSTGLNKPYQNTTVQGVPFDEKGMIPGSYMYSNGGVSMQGMVDAAAGSAYALTINPGTGKPNGESYPGQPYYYSPSEQSEQTTWMKNSGTIRVYDNPNRQNLTSISTWTTIVVARDYMGTGKDVILGTFRWGWKDTGKNPVHSGNGINLKGNTPNANEQSIIRHFYKNYNFFR